MPDPQRERGDEMVIRMREHHGYRTALGRDHRALMQHGLIPLHRDALDALQHALTTALGQADLLRQAVPPHSHSTTEDTHHA